MKVLGIEFAPLVVPLHRRLETVAAAAWFVVLAFGSIIAAIFTLYLLLFTRLCYPTLLYLAWVYLDRDVCHRGGRPSAWVRGWAWWAYFRDYFPLRLHSAMRAPLDPRRSYLFCCFPHGMLPAGVFGAFATSAGDFRALFPRHQPRIVTLTQHYLFPFFRELALGLGGIAATPRAIASALDVEKGGRAVALMPGGAAEAYFCQPGQYRILLRKRKGFVKLALRLGVALVPVVSFGETDLFRQMEGSTLRRWQERLRNFVGMAPILPIGRGFFQYSFGIIPNRKEVNTVVGEPIDVEKVENPTVEQIETLHKKFSDALIKLFEEQKHLYVKNSENIHMEM